MAAFMEFINKSEYTGADLKKALDTPLPDITPTDLSGKVVIVTGANVGIGYETAKSIASMKPQKLILACRNSEKADAAKKTIATATNFHDIESWELDLASFASTQAFAKRFIETGLALDILVSNAGIAAGPIPTADGYEVTMQVNHLSNVLLVGLLYPALKKAAHNKEARFPRVVVVSSDTHFWTPLPAAEDPHPLQTMLQKQELGPFGVYPATKLFNILFAKAFTLKCPDQIYAFSANPGATESELAAKDPLTGQPAPRPFQHFVKPRTTYDGAKSIIYAAVSPKVGESGGYYSEMEESHTRKSTQGEGGKQFALNVWNDTVEVLKKHVPNADFYTW